MDDKRIQKIFEHIESLNIDLVYDPILKGPKFLNKMVATCRNMTNSIQKYEREVAQESLIYERQLHILEAEYEMNFNDLMTNDPEVAKQPSAKDREAKVNNKLKELRQDIQECNAKITDLKHVGTVVRSKLRELKDINRDIRLQISLVGDEIQIGNAWGDQSQQTNYQIQAKEIDLDSLLPEDTESPPEEAKGYEDLFGEVEDVGAMGEVFATIDAETPVVLEFKEVIEEDASSEPDVIEAVEEDISVDYEDLLKDL